HSEDSCSEEVGDVSEDDESSSHPPCRQSLSTLSSEGRRLRKMKNKVNSPDRIFE
ncbi:hypothetical protein BgiBS90_036241, partial [Biomphalaria glabrata]